MRRGNLIILILALVMGGLAAFMARNWIERQAVAKPAATPMGTIVVAAAPLTFGAALTKENVAEIAWAGAQIPEGAFSSKDELLREGRRFVLGSIERNEPILKPKVTPPGQRASLSALLDEGQRAVTVRVDDVRGVAGFILPGDRVDVVLIRAESRQGETINSADVLLDFVKVLAIDQLLNERKEGQQATVAKAVTLQVTPEQAQKILLAGNLGKLSLVLRQSNEASSAQGRRISDSDLGFGERKKPEKPEVPEVREVAAVVPPPPPPPPPLPPIVERVEPANVVIFHGTKRETYPVMRSSVRSQ